MVIFLKVYFYENKAQKIDPIILISSGDADIKNTIILFTKRRLITRAVLLFLLLAVTQSSKRNHKTNIAERLGQRRFKILVGGPY